MKFKRLIAFSDLLNKFRLVKRQVYANGEERLENDMEHSYALAMLAWYIVDSEGLHLDLPKILKYCLAHDLIETYAGDTYIYGSSVDLASKKKREQEAEARLAKEFPEMPSLHVAIRDYEARKDEEGRFVYALDKLQPVINIYLDGGRTWNEAKITLSMIFENKDSKIAHSPEVMFYWRELLKILKEGEKELFAS